MTASEHDRQGATQPPDDPEVLRREIDSLRQDLGDTVEALAAKVDVKAQARTKVDQIKTQARVKAHELGAQAKDRTVQVRTNARQAAGTVSTRAKGAASRPAPAITAGAAAVLLVAVIVW